jgi:hypothetical protein
MTATASYDGRAFAETLYTQYSEQATIDVLDAEDRAIARLARERCAGRWTGTPYEWDASMFARTAWYTRAVLERHPNPARTP